MREAERKFVIEGPRAVESALVSGVEVEAIYFEPSAGIMAKKVLELAAKIGYRTYETVPGVLERAADAVSPQTLAAIASFVDVGMSDLDLDSFIVVMAGVRDPGNAGTIIRTSLAARASAVILCDQCVDIYNPKTVRSSAGALFSVPIAIADTFAQVNGYLRSKGYKLIGTSSHASTPYWDADLAGNVAIVLGNEGSGLDASYSELFDESVTIPIDPVAESLNVGVAGSILMFEAMHQRMDSPT
ncbi:MAG: RNA methyltransferase [Actinomycetota bacterium]|nr:MAG: RNA methyltransferase [Actinomycetota bacterium]